MKKITKLTKILLVFVTIFSQLSGVATVLAEEIITKPLNLTLEQNISSDYSIDGYTLTYISENNDYEEYVEVDGEEVEKTYDLVLTSMFTYLNDEVTEPFVNTIDDVTGKTLNTVRSTYELEPISKYYDGRFDLTIAVYDGESKLYERTISCVVDNTLKGFSGYLTDGVTPGEEIVSTISQGNYSVTEGKEYTQYLKLMVGELSPNAEYKLVYADGSESEVMTGEELRNYPVVGNKLDLTDKLAGEYLISTDVQVVEVNAGVEVNTYNYGYETSIEYGTSEDNDTLFNGIYEENNIIFINGYALVVANGVQEGVVVPSVGEVLEGVFESDIILEITDEEGNLLDLTDENVLASEIKNDYVLSFTNGANARYNVVVVTDADSDNTFTVKDIELTMEAYLSESLLLPMDMVSEEEDEIGKITFDDVMFLNELIKENRDLETIPENNENLYLSLGEVPSEVYVGDTFELDVIVNSDNVNDYIDGISGEVTTLGNLELTSVEASDGYTFYYENGKFVAAGNPITDDGMVALTLTFTAVEEGTDTITVNGETAKYLNITSFEEMTKEVVVVRNVSTNNNLASLNASVGTFDREFDADVTVYTLTVPYDTEKVILSGALADIYASADGLIEYELTEDKTVAMVTVTAEDGSVKTYTIYIVKDAKPVTEPITYYYSTNNYLKLIEVKGYEISFDRDTYEYNITVGSDVDSLDIKAITEDSRARAQITGNENFKTGENVVTITVTAENGTTKEYKLIVNKEAEKKDNGLTELEDSSNTAEKVVIIILIILVVLGLLYLIFKKDDDEEVTQVKEVKKDNKDNKPKDNKNNKAKDNKNKKSKK